jgi:hypothetical protein
LLLEAASLAAAGVVEARVGEEGEVRDDEQEDDDPHAVVTRS